MCLQVEGALRALGPGTLGDLSQVGRVLDELQSGHGPLPAGESVCEHTHTPHTALHTPHEPPQQKLARAVPFPKEKKEKKDYTPKGVH